MDVHPVQLQNTPEENPLMLSRDQFLELFSLSNYRNIIYEKPQLVITEKSWSKYRQLFLKKTSVELPLNITDTYDSLIWGELDQGTKTLVALNKRPPPIASYETASAMAKMGGITSLRDWFAKIPTKFREFNIAVPGDPPKAYAEIWPGWGEFLQTKRIATQNMHKHQWNYEEAKRYVNGFKIKTVQQFRDFMETPAGDPRIPKRPDNLYKDNGWAGWSEFLSPRFHSYEEAKKVMAPYGLRTEADFRKLGKDGKRPEGIPSLPYVTYEKEFESWADFLGYQGEINYPKTRN